MDAKLFCPHSKEYCVGFQSRFATLKGIENMWTQVKTDQSCEWENQQHGRNHHVKVVINKPKVGAFLALQLCQGDGSPAPDFTKTKSGAKKATMLVGIDAREPRLGLSWTAMVQEGPRKWLPASSVIIEVKPRRAGARCDVTADDEGAHIAIPADKFVIIPIRIEVLSAAKGAGDFSRYSVHCFETSGADSRTPLPGPDTWTWRSPPILIEAKWLPAAPVRLTNKQRFGPQRRVVGPSDTQGPTPAETTCHSGGGCGSGVGTVGHAHTHNERVFGPGHSSGRHGHQSFASVEQLVSTFRSVSAFLADPSTVAHDPSLLAQLEVPIQELQCALSSFHLRRAQRFGPSGGQGASSAAPSRAASPAFGMAGQPGSHASAQFQHHQGNAQHGHLGQRPGQVGHPPHLHYQGRTNYHAQQQPPQPPQPQQERGLAYSVPQRQQVDSARPLPVVTKTENVAPKRKPVKKKPAAASGQPFHQHAQMDAAKKPKTTHELLSSPPRGPRFAPLSPEMMAAFALPGSALGSAPTAQSCSAQNYVGDSRYNAAALGRGQSASASDSSLAEFGSGASDPSFAEFNLLAAAASATSCVVPSKPGATADVES